MDIVIDESIHERITLAFSIALNVSKLPLFSILRVSRVKISKTHFSRSYLSALLDTFREMGGWTTVLWESV